MPHSPELLRRYSLQLLSNAQGFAARRRQRANGAPCKALAREACLVAQAARAYAMRKRQANDSR